MPVCAGMTILNFPACLFVLAALFTAIPAFAQNYPNKLIRIVTASPGSTNDWGARLIAQDMTKRPRPARDRREPRRARGRIRRQVAAPDGYTLLFYGNAVWLLPLLRDHVRYDPLRDFAPVSLSTTSPTIVRACIRRCR